MTKTSTSFRLLPQDAYIQVRVLVRHDADEAGMRGAKRLAKTSPLFRPVQVPHGKDISEFYQAGGDVYFWIEQALR
jgi:hypothetical protein